MLEQTVKHCVLKLNADNQTLRTSVGQKCGSGILLSSHRRIPPITRRAAIHTTPAPEKKKASAFHKNLILFCMRHVD